MERLFFIQLCKKAQCLESLVPFSKPSKQWHRKVPYTKQMARSAASLNIIILKNFQKLLRNRTIALIFATNQ